jgi:hypothetical protein
MALSVAQQFGRRLKQAKRKFAPCCGICETEFDEAAHTPVLLTACGHSLCKDCANALLKAKKIKCPTCSAVTPAATVASLPKNFALIDSIRDLATTTAAPKLSRGQAIPRAAPPPAVDVGKISARELDDFQEKIAAEKFKRSSEKLLELLTAQKDKFDTTVTALNNNISEIKDYELELARIRRERKTTEQELRVAKAAIERDRAIFIASYEAENRRLKAKLPTPPNHGYGYQPPIAVLCPTPDTSALVPTLPPGFGIGGTHY